ncbi:replicative DNA helicase [uncultured Ruminococcus sp.]|uniref:replicative DNA helicase n=1 Tax=uncultured Ruminococcus sp. TaxID=165186 RepID=UPI00292CEB87|nr:replicative DNA helicase [uncultured Ruminococcus sp.]
MPDNNTTIYNGLRLPYSPEAEQAVLGAILMEPDAIARVAEILPSAEYFYLNNHRTIYAAMMSMFTSGRPVDQITVLEMLKMERDFDDATGKTYLVQLAQSCPSIANVENYAHIVRDKYDVRALISAARDIIEDSTEGESEPQMLIDSAEQKIFDIRRGKNIQGLQRIDEVLFQTFDRLDMLSREDDSVKPVSTGIGDLDRVITGLNRSDLILLAARPGMGKTSFALNIARNVSVIGKKTVAFFSLEMTKEQLASRLLSSEALVGGTKLRTGRLSNEEWERLIGAGDVLKNANMYLDDTPGITVPEMKAKLRRLKRVDLVVIDYLQLMSTGRRDGNRVQEISELTRNLKILAKEIDVPVICLSQLSRASEQRQDHRPQLSDLRDSGSIEQDADIVLFLYRDGYYDREKGAETAQAAVDQNSGECIVAKNRHGETTIVKLHWQGEFMRFTGTERNRD